MEWWQALLLALLQGLTEFLPISSSAHLLLPTLLMDWPDQGLAFDVAVHFGTLLAVMLYFRKDLLTLSVQGARCIVEREMNDGGREIFFLAIATLPAVLVGFFLNDYMDSLRTIPVIATTTIVFALALGFADRRAGTASQDAVAGAGSAFLIGCAQALAPIPGTSRSGITITAALLLGLSRTAAARFSFLLSIPVISGAALLKTLELLETGSVVPWGMLLGAGAFAALSAYLCIAAFLALIERIGMMPFVLYRLLLGALLVVIWLA
ncbi:MAG: undecaprenyl-diphosphate phosphatase [Pseudomonadota bacterium]